MIIDGLLMFDGTYSVANGLVGVNQFASGATNPSTNTLDLLAQRDIGDANTGPAGDMTAIIMITTAFTGGTSVNFQVQGSTDNSTWTTYSETGAVAVAGLTAGSRYSLPMPSVNPDAGPAPRYLRLAYVNVGANTTGAVIAWLGSPTDQRYYKPGIVVSN
jgi:hypothetical protein